MDLLELLFVILGVEELFGEILVDALEVVEEEADRLEVEAGAEFEEFPRVVVGEDGGAAETVGEMVG